MSRLSKSRLPEFVLVGTMRAGTTSLWRYLSAHPDIFMPAVKENWFMIADTLRRVPKEDPRYPVVQRKIFNINDYEKLFAGANESQIIGEAGSAYLYRYKESIKTIKSLLGDVKVIIGLRNPVDRAYSLYRYNVMCKIETLSFEQALDAEASRISSGWDSVWAIKDMGFYYQQVKSFLDSFSSVFVYEHNDLLHNRTDCLQRIYDFLGVESDFVPANIGIEINKAGEPKNVLADQFNTMSMRFGKQITKRFPQLTKTSLYGLYNKIRNNNLLTPSLPLDVYNYLHSEYLDDTEKLQDILELDLSCWLDFDANFVR